MHHLNSLQFVIFKINILKSIRNTFGLIMKPCPCWHVSPHFFDSFGCIHCLKFQISLLWVSGAIEIPN